MSRPGTVPRAAGSAADGGASADLGALATTHLSFSIGGASILHDVSMSVGDAEFVGVIGPNGAGKSTLFNLLSGLLRPTSGRVLLGGQDVTSLSAVAGARAGLGRTFQTSSVFPALTVHENVRLAAQAHLGGSLRVWGRARSDARARDVAGECLSRVGLQRRSSTLGGSLSHGDKRKLEIAIVLASAPRVLLLDEPMAGLAVEDMPDLVDLIRSVHVEQQVSVLMVEHHIEVVLDVADRIAVMDHGGLLAFDAPEAVMADEAVQTAYLGEGL